LQSGEAFRRVQYPFVASTLLQPVHARNVSGISRAGSKVEARRRGTRVG